jgi:hypothetical protein
MSPLVGTYYSQLFKDLEIFLTVDSKTYTRSLGFLGKRIIHLEYKARINPRYLRPPLIQPIIFFRTVLGLCALDLQIIATTVATLLFLVVEHRCFVASSSKIRL